MDLIDLVNVGNDTEHNFFDVIDTLLEMREFNWLGMLGYVRENHCRTRENRILWESNWECTDPQRINWKEAWDARTGPECFEQWLWESGVGPNAYYLSLEEPRLNGDIRYHVLAADWQEYAKGSLRLWKNITGGWAYKREIGSGVRGLLGHLVMREGCTLQVNCGFKVSYTKENFRPWRPKSDE
jgi:hypothetical protein